MGTDSVHIKKQIKAFNKRREQSKEIYEAIKGCQRKCCRLDRESNVIRTSCDKDALSECMEGVRKQFGLHSVGLYGDELIFMGKEPKPTPLGKKRKEELKGNSLPERAQRTRQEWNEKYGCWETVIEET